jgi:hypothetical protein
MLLSTTDSTRLNSSWNPATIHLSYGTAYILTFTFPLSHSHHSDINPTFPWDEKYSTTVSAMFFSNYDSSTTIFISVRGPWSAFVFLSIIIQHPFAVPHTHFLLAENVLPVNTNKPAMNLALIRFLLHAKI